MNRLQRRLTDVAVFAVALALLATLADFLNIDPGKLSRAPHYVWQVQAWLHGHNNLGPSNTTHVVNDLITMRGHFYSIYPPLPALVMLPFVWALGDSFSDVWFTWGVGALNIVLMFRTLEAMRARRVTRRSLLENLVLTTVFGFGTVALWLSLGGAVWFTGQMMSATGIILVLHSSVCRRWWLASLGVGMVAITRSSEVPIAIVPAIVYLHDLGVGRKTAGRSVALLPARWPSLREIAAFVVPAGLCGAVLLARNQMFFHDPLSTGYDIHTATDVISFPYGLTNWHYIWPNFVIDFLRWPDFNFHAVNDAHPTVDLVAHGMGTSMFFSTPLMLIFLFTKQGRTSSRWLRIALWAGVVAVFVPVIMFQAAGSFQVGARYIFPVYPPLFLLLAMRADRIGPRWIALAGLGVFSNILLARAFWMGPPSVEFAWTNAGIVAAVCLLACLLLARENRALGTAPDPDATGEPSPEAVPETAAV